MTRALQHCQFENGTPRIVRSAKRARLLRKRGVPIFEKAGLVVAEHCRRHWVWYEHKASYDARERRRKIRNARRRTVRRLRLSHGMRWLDALLTVTLPNRLADDFASVERRITPEEVEFWTHVGKMTLPPRIAADLAVKGFAIQIAPATELERASRQTPPVILYYNDPTIPDIEVDLE